MSRWVLGLLLLIAISLRSAHAANFVVHCHDQHLAQQIAQLSEQLRVTHAQDWFGYQLPDWKTPCPIVVTITDSNGGGATSFSLGRGTLSGLRMTVEGRPDKLLTDVIPHEVLHAVLYSVIRAPIPRWIDEGSCTAMESPEFRHEMRAKLAGYLRTKRGIPFHDMFAMSEYPRDVMPLYAQGYSTAEFLIQHGGKRHLGEYLLASCASNKWQSTLTEFYGFADLSKFQDAWLSWFRSGSPESGVQITASYGAGGRMAPMEWKDGRWQRCGQQPSTDAPVATDTPRPLTPVTPPTTPPASAPPIAKTDPEVKTPACGCDKSKHCACDPAKHCACDPSKQCACDPTLADRLKTAEQTIAGLQAELANLHLLATRPSTEGQGQPQTGKDAAVDIPALAKQVVDKLPPFKTQIVDLNGKVLTETETKLGETLKLRLVPIAPRPTQ